MCAAGLAAFYNSASTARDLQQTVPLERWDIERAYTPSATPGSMTIYTRFAAFCEGISDFDGALFRLPLSEVVVMDPQQRVLLEETGAALSDAASNLQSPIAPHTGKAQLHAERLLSVSVGSTAQ